MLRCQRDRTVWGLLTVLAVLGGLGLGLAALSAYVLVERCAAAGWAGCLAGAALLGPAGAFGITVAWGVFAVARAIVANWR